jgi:hypothetical protein
MRTKPLGSDQPAEQNTAVGKLLDTITHRQGYSWFANGGVVMVTHDGALQGRKNLLNLRISEFTIAREVTLQAASLELLGKLYFPLHPHATGIVGDYPSGNPQFRVGPWTIEECHGSADSQLYRLAARKWRMGRATATVEHGQRPAIRTLARVRV